MTTTAEYREIYSNEVDRGPSVFGNRFVGDDINALCDKVEILEQIIRRELMHLYEKEEQASLEKSLKEILS